MGGAGNDELLEPPLIDRQVLGHASIEQTMRYAHLSPEVTRDAVKVLDPPAPITAPVGAHEGHMDSGQNKTA